MSGFDDWRCDPPAMPSGNGRLEKLPLLHCSKCSWLGRFTEAVDHWRASQHDIWYRGVKQDFSAYAVTPSELMARR